MIAPSRQSQPITHQAEILLPAAVGHGFDYRVPPGMALWPGDVVRVPFGRGESLGVVLGEGTAKLAASKIKSVEGGSDIIPSLPPSCLEFIRWAAWYNCAPMGAVLKMVLPLSDMDKKVRGDVVEKLLATNTHSSKIASLNAAQEAASNAITQSIGSGFSVTLLDGVTGSGKTEVYFRAIESILKRESGQVLILLPEISLSVQWLERFESRFGFTPPAWHSGVTPARKRATLAAIADGRARVVVGARSALFLPYKELQLLVVDEEHDASFKQEEGVMYHARDMAVARARFEKIPALLVSATPSLETVENVRQGKYRTLSLPERHKDAMLPTVDMIDMRQAKMEASQFVSPVLRQVLADTLKAGHQSLLFLNRRGYAPLMLCRTCGHRFCCPDCSSWLVLHGGKARGSRLEGESDFLKPQASSPKPYLQCHHCNHRVPVPHQCPTCSEPDSLHACGPGVERMQEEVKDFLPDARIAVLASDQTATPAQLTEIIQAMDRGEIDILIGTQMIAKGHHFPGLATVGVVDADLGLAGGDLRAAERTYQLLHQLSGRAGREAVQGHVYLQSYLPDHPVMQALLSGDRDAFFSAELAARERAGMPPYARLAAVIIEGKKEDAVIKTARDLTARLSAAPDAVDVFGPAPAALGRLRDKYRWRILVRAPRKVNLPDYMQLCVAAANIPSSLKVKIDIDPMSFM